MTELVLYDEMCRAITAAHAVDEVKDIRDKAQAMEAYFRLAKNKDAETRCWEIRQRAERRAGELLAATVVPHRPEKGSQAATLSNLGLSKSQSSRWQQKAAIPAPAFEKALAAGRTAIGDGVATAAKVMKQAMREARIVKREEAAPREGARYQLIPCKVEDLALDEKVDAIITDPPYPKEYTSCYRALGELAARVLKPGGHLLCMTGQANLFDFAPLLIVPPLRYQWTLAYFTPGASVQCFGRHIKSNWKPVLWLTHGACDWEHVEDVIRSPEGDKRFHVWGQSVGGFAVLVERFTVRGAVVLDPFCGAGTTGLACLTTDRRFIGSDVDEDAIASAAKRLGECDVTA